MLRLQFLVGAIWRAIKGRESKDLQDIKGILSIANVLLCIAYPGSLAGEDSNHHYNTAVFSIHGTVI